MSLRSHRRRLARIFSLSTLAAIAACAGRVESESTTKFDAGDNRSLGDAAADAATDTRVDAQSCAAVLEKPDDGCGYTVSLPCGINRSDSGAFPFELCDSICASVDGGQHWGCGMPSCTEGCPPPPAKIYSVTCYTCIGGRRPAGYTVSTSVGSVRGWFEQIADLEAASITAFAHLGEDLLALNAPVALLRAIDRAKADEVSHASTMRTFAEAAGGTAKPAKLQVRAPKSRVAIAIENVVEGCVRETFGALVADWQSRHAEHPGLRLAMRKIARDERNHAALSWTIDAWLDETLTATERDEVRAAAFCAVQTLRREAYFAFDRETERALGLPNRLETDALIDSLESELWSPRAA